MVGKMVLFFVAMAVCSGAYAQNDSLMPAFAAGERLKYTVSYRATLWPNTDMGDVEMNIYDDEVDGIETYRISARATVKGVFRWFYELDDRYESWLRKSDMLPVKASAQLLEGDYRFSSQFLYDWDGMTSFNSYRNHNKRKTPVESVVELVEGAMDGVSLFYNLRMHDISAYTPGEERTLALLLKDRVQYVKYKYYGREVRKVPGLGRIRTLKFSCQLVNDDADSFEDGSEFFIWISDDSNKVPVFLESPLRVGSVRARLTGYDGLLYDDSAI